MGHWIAAVAADNLLVEDQNFGISLIELAVLINGHDNGCLAAEVDELMRFDVLGGLCAHESIVEARTTFEMEVALGQSRRSGPGRRLGADGKRAVLSKLMLSTLKA